MNYLIHATPVHLSLCLQYLILLFTIAIITAFTLLLLLLFYYYHHYKTVATDKPLWASLFSGAAELTTHLLRLINILWLPLCWINKFGFYFPCRLLRSPILVGQQPLMRLWSWPKHHHWGHGPLGEGRQKRAKTKTKQGGSDCPTALRSGGKIELAADGHRREATEPYPPRPSPHR
jgi:hypothetical protein